MKTNTVRARTKKLRNYGVKGGEGDLVRAMDCIVHTAAMATGSTDEFLAQRGWAACGGAACAAHSEPRQRGGVGEGRMRLFPACAVHHAEAGESSHLHGPSSKRRKFENLYSLDVGAISDRIALEHEPPLGIRGLAARFDAWRGIDGFISEPVIEMAIGPRLAGYDLAALMGWVRRRMARTYAESSLLREDIAADVSCDLFGPESDRFDDALWTLCREAGWPS